MYSFKCNEIFTKLFPKSPGKFQEYIKGELTRFCNIPWKVCDSIELMPIKRLAQTKLFEKLLKKSYEQFKSVTPWRHGSTASPRWCHSVLLWQNLNFQPIAELINGAPVYIPHNILLRYETKQFISVAVMLQMSSNFGTMFLNY